MPDVFSIQRRSDVMSRIRSRGNKETELALMRVFREQRIVGWRRHLQLRIGPVELKKAEVEQKRREGSKGLKVAGVGGKGRGKELVRASSRRHLQALEVKVRPDFVFRQRRVAVFVDGCFWHGCPRCYVRPRQNRKFWDAKFATNQARDRKVNAALRKAGWKVLRIWEHELAKKHAGRLGKKLRGKLSHG